MSADLVGQPLAHFRVTEKLGQGGMGIVYKAIDEKLGRTVAIKVLPAGFAADEDRRRRFLREARSAAAVAHASIATVYEIGEAEGRVYIAMELVEGRTLREVLDAKRLSISESLRIVREVARGLARAHEKGIVHRDLKPDNVMVTDDLEVKILDFGLAKLREADELSNSALAGADTAHVTQEGAVLGTPGYMSPEQVRGRAVDHRTDLFSLGVVLYEMVTGARPFAGQSPMEIGAAILHDTPSRASARNDAVSPEVERILERCLAKKPDERYASARELLADVEALVVSDASRSGSATAATGKSPRARRSRAPFAIGAAAILGVAIASAFALRSRTPPRDPAASSVAPAASSAPARGVPLTELPAPKTSSAEAAKEYALAMQAYRDANIDAAVKHLVRATQIDPGFAFANVLLAGYAGMSWDESRTHLATAVEHRDQLSAREDELLQALQASFATFPPDREGTAKRFRALVERHPNDLLFLYTAAGMEFEAGHIDEGLALLDRARDVDPKSPLPDAFRANNVLGRGDLAGALESVNRCLALSPAATTCISTRAAVAQRTGDCKALEQNARAVLAAAPDQRVGYDWLMAALISQNASAESVAELSRRAREHEINAEARAFSEAWEPVYQAELYGDFAAAIARFPPLDALKAKCTSNATVSSITTLELWALTESGQRDRALALGDEYMKRRPALTLDDEADVRAKMLSLRFSAGAVSEAEVRATRAAWAEDLKRKLPESFGNLVWFFFYGETSTTPALAQDALEALPRFSPLPPYEGLVYEERMMGTILRLAGRVDEAIPHLRRAVRSCFAMDRLTSHVYAAQSLGEALEAKGDKSGACEAYGEVLARWGGAKPRSITADAARARMKKLGCAK